MRDLLILRHGKAEAEPEDDDFRRELADKGKRHTQRIAIWLQRQELVPDKVVSSPASRALTTAQKCCKAMGLDARMIVRDQRVYDSGLAGLVEILKEQHNPEPPEADREPTRWWRTPPVPGITGLFAASGTVDTQAERIGDAGSTGSSFHIAQAVSVPITRQR